MIKVSTSLIYLPSSISFDRLGLYKVQKGQHIQQENAGHFILLNYIKRSNLLIIIRIDQVCETIRTFKGSLDRKYSLFLKITSDTFPPRESRNQEDMEYSSCTVMSPFQSSMSTSCPILGSRKSHPSTPTPPPILSFSLTSPNL